MWGRIRQVAPDENPAGVVSRPDEVVDLVAAEHLRAGHLPATDLLTALIPGRGPVASPRPAPTQRPGQDERPPQNAQPSQNTQPSQNGRPAQPAPSEPAQQPGRTHQPAAQPGRSAQPGENETYFAPPSRRGGSDPIRDWQQASASGKKRSEELRAIDDAVRRLPDNPSERHLQRVLTAVDAWRAVKSRSSHRWEAVSQLRRAVNARLAEFESQPAAQPGPSSRHRSAGGSQMVPLVPVPQRQPQVTGYGPADGFEAELRGYQVVLGHDDDPGEYGNVVELPGLLTITLDKFGGVPVLEIVTRPSRGLQGGAFDGRAERSDVVAAFEQVLQILRRVTPERSYTLSQLFPASLGYEVDQLAEGLRVKINSYSTNHMLVHQTATSPLSEMAEYIRHVRSNTLGSTPPTQVARRDADAALDFSRDARNAFRNWVGQNPDFAPYVTEWDADELRGALALGYMQVAAVIRGRSPQHHPKDYTVASSRASLAAIRSGLGYAPQAFLEANADALAARFTRTFNSHSSRPNDALLDGLMRQRGPEHQPATFGEYLDNLLVAEPARFVSQLEAMSIRTHFVQLEGNPVRGRALLDPLVVVTENRAYGPAPEQATQATTVQGAATLSDFSLRLYNQARVRRGLEAVGWPIDYSQQPGYAQQGYSSVAYSQYSPPTRTTGNSGPARAPEAADTTAHPAAPVAPTPVPAAAAPSPALVELAGQLPAMEPGERAAAVGALPLPDREALATDESLVAGLRDSLPAQDFSDLAAQLLVVVPPGTDRPEEARQEAEALISGMLGDPDTTVGLLTGRRRLVVVPRDTPLTSFDPFHEPDETNDHGRAIETERGAFRGRLAWVGEENLLGDTTGVPHADVFEDGYSSARHEWAHALHSVLSEADRNRITEVYEAKRREGTAQNWPDGVFPNYSSSSAYEYFAQLSNAYQGANTGTDPITGRPRNNGADWVEQNDPE
ncbi:hypothetical protein ADK38_25475, partial [Streptomyces varsoviensis]